MGTLERPSSGRVSITGLDVAEMSDRELAAVRATRIGFVFQQFFLAEHSTTLENVADGLLYAGAAVAERRERAAEALTRVGLGDRLHSRPTQLSGGERQRVAIARALVGRPAIVLADEPTGNLDSATGQAIMALIDELNAEGATIVVITHEHEIAARFPRQITLLDGRVVSDSRKEETTVTRMLVLAALAAALALDRRRRQRAGGRERVPDIEPAERARARRRQRPAGAAGQAVRSRTCRSRSPIPTAVRSPETSPASPSTSTPLEAGRAASSPAADRAKRTSAPTPREMATAPPFTANFTVGNYTVDAHSDYGTVELSLSNTANGLPSSITATGASEPRGDRQRQLRPAAAGAGHRRQRQPGAGRDRHLLDPPRTHRRERELPRRCTERDHRLERPRHLTGRSWQTAFRDGSARPPPPPASQRSPPTPSTTAPRPRRSS